MGLYDGPRDVQTRLDELDRSLGAAGYDHGRGALTGWRAERQQAQVRDTERMDRSAPVRPSLRAWLLAKLPGLRRLSQRIS